MQIPQRIREDFLKMMQQPEPSFELARAALLVAAESDPTLDVEAELRLLHGWAQELATRIDPEWNNLQRLARLRAFVFEELGFKGAVKDYYSPSNSLFHEVLRRRRGIPLTLAIVMLEVGWGIGMPLEGVSFPGHFLVRLSGEPGDLLLDPYSHGTSVHEEDCRQMLLDSTGGRVDFDQQMLASVGKRAMIGRLLRNLKDAYLRAGDDEQALSATDRLLLFDPRDVDQTRDRGLLLFRLHRYGPALESLRSYLAEAPGAADREAIERHVAHLRSLTAELN
jgi:regulator of sirC expression with transglutaminase-like and TPR domain